MNQEEHIAASRDFMRGEELLTDEGLGMLAAEAIWGATTQVVNAIHHVRTRRAHANNNRERRRAIQYLTDKYGVGDDIEDGFDTALRQLHNHFYHSHLSDADLMDSLESGRRFIAAMIELAEREMAELTMPQEDSRETPSDGAPPL